jgi:predicted dinucleotide-binding enzyme
MGTLENVAILGTGPVGLGLAELFSRQGHAVSIGTRDASRRRPALPRRVALASFAEAADFGEVVVVAVRHAAAAALLERLEPTVRGKLVIDADNAWIRQDFLAARFRPGETEGQWMARHILRSRVTRAFSHIDWDVLVTAATQERHHWAAGFAADGDRDARQLAELIDRIGYVPYRVGTLAESAPLDVGGALWARMFTPAQMASALGRPSPPRHS